MYDNFFASPSTFDVFYNASIDEVGAKNHQLRSFEYHAEAVPGNYIEFFPQFEPLDVCFVNARVRGLIGPEDALVTPVCEAVDAFWASVEAGTMFNDVSDDIWAAVDDLLVRNPEILSNL